MNLRTTIQLWTLSLTLLAALVGQSSALSALSASPCPETPLSYEGCMTVKSFASLKFVVENADEGSELCFFPFSVEKSERDDPIFLYDTNVALRCFDFGACEISGEGTHMEIDGDDTTVLISGFTFIGATDTSIFVETDTGKGTEVGQLICDSKFLNNQADSTGGGGAVYLGRQAKVYVRHSSFFGNFATTDHGGAIFNYEGDLTVLESVFKGNSARKGGAISTDDGGILVLGENDFSLNDSRKRGPVVSVDGLFYDWGGNTADNECGLYNVNENECQGFKEGKGMFLKGSWADKGPRYWEPTQSPSPRPTLTDSPTFEPTSAPTDRPTGTPTSKPTGTRPCFARVHIGDVSLNGPIETVNGGVEYDTGLQTYVGGSLSRFGVDMSAFDCYRAPPTPSPTTGRPTLVPTSVSPTRSPTREPTSSPTYSVRLTDGELCISNGQCANDMCGFESIIDASNSKLRRVCCPSGLHISFGAMGNVCTVTDPDSITLHPTYSPTAPPTTYSPTIHPTSSPTNTRLLMPKHQFGPWHLKLYWQEGYEWQEKLTDLNYCAECDRDDCTKGESLELGKCEYMRPQQKFISTIWEYGENNYMQIHLNDDRSSCFTHSSVRQLVFQTCLLPNDPLFHKQLFWGRPSQTMGFKVHPVTKWLEPNREKCLTNHHHPRESEYLYFDFCWVAERATTDQWILNFNEDPENEGLHW